MKYLFIILISLHITNWALAQTGRIEGRIVDDQGQNVQLANIRVNGTNLGSVSDSEGKFTIDGLKPSTYTLTISLVGNEAREVSNVVVVADITTQVGTITLLSSSILLDEVVVSPGSYSVMESSQTTGLIAFSEENIKNMVWAEDITRSVTRLPGISSSDYSSKFAIRGGEADEVLISIDGMELLEPFHQRDYSGGLFSIVDVEAIRGIDLMMGGFSAVNGNRLSGVFAMKTKRVEDNTNHVSLGLSTMNARIYADGKFAKNRGSYLISARRGMLDKTLKIIGNDEYFPKFYDALAKMEYKLTDRQILSAHVLHSGDRAFINNSPEGDQFDQFETKYFNTYTWVTLNSIFSGKLDARSILYYGDLNQKRKGGYDKYDNSDKGYFGVDDKRGYNYLGFKQDWNLEATEKFHLNFGFDVKMLMADYHHLDSINELRVNASEQIYTYQRYIDEKLSPSGEQVGSYLTARYKLLPKLIAETGIRYDFASYTGDKNISPRLALVYAFDRRTFARAAYGHYYQTQFINMLDINNGNAKFDPAELVEHYVLSFEHSTRKGLNFRTELYYKDYTRVNPLWQNLRDHLENYPEARNDNAHVVFNGITSKGIELFVKYDQGKEISYWLSYALAEAIDDVKQIDFDGLLTKRTGKVPRLNNQYHSVYIDINYRPTAKWHFNAYWVFYYGWPRTDYTYRYTYLPNGDIHFYQVHGVFNDTYYLAYHRLDLRINKFFDLKHGGKITAFLHIVNAYNRENLKKFDLDTTNENEQLSIDANGNYVPTTDNKYWLPFTPVIGLKWELQY